jgi:hypothetical protein
MRKIFILILLMLTPVITLAQTSTLDHIPGFVLWNSKSIDAAADRLEKELGDKHLVYETIGNYKGHSMYLVLRGKTDTAEFHVNESDFQITWRGKANFVIGGEVVNARNKTETQIRGTAIKGGKSYLLTPGDIIHVPPSTPHQLLIDPAEPYMYLLMKLDEDVDAYKK